MTKPGTFERLIPGESGGSLCALLSPLTSCAKPTSFKTATPSPLMFFVSAHSKGLAGESSVSADSKEVRRTAWRGRMVRRAQRDRADFTTRLWHIGSYCQVVTCKWLGRC